MAQPSAVGNQEPEPAPPADSGSSKARIIADLMEQLKELEDKSEELEKQESKIVEAMDKLKVDIPSRELQIIAFVRAIEKANQFLALKDYLKDKVEYVMHDSDEFVAFQRLVKEERVHDDHRFNKLDFQDILDAVKECIYDLQYKRNEDHILDQEKMNVSPCSKENKQLTFSAFAEENDSEPLNPFLNLVYSALEKSYVLHKDPQVGLDLMKKHNPVYYNHCFIAGLMTKCSEKTVFVRSIPSSYDENRVKASFSACGEIESVILENFNRWSQVAHVTFKDSEGAKLAPILKREWCFSVKPVLEFPERRSDVSTELIEALNTYKTLRSYFSGKESGKPSRHRLKRLRRKQQQEAKATAAMREQEEAATRK